MTPDADSSARLLTDRIRRGIPTAYFRFGDGFIECVRRPAGKTNTCDGEVYTAELAAAMRRALAGVVGSPDAFLGDWGREPETTVYCQEWLSLVRGAKATLIHFEALLIQRESEALVDFYRAVKEDRRDKLFMGPRECAGAAKMLGARHFVMPMMADLHTELEQAPMKLVDCDFEVLLYGAGLAGNVAAVRCWERHPERTYVHLGSAMDPLFWKRTRSNQLSPLRARAMFAELLS